MMRRRSFIVWLAGAAPFAAIGRALAAPPAVIADGTPIGRGKLLVVHEDAAGRIVALDSSAYLEPHPTGPATSSWSAPIAARGSSRRCFPAASRR